MNFQDKLIQCSDCRITLFSAPDNKNSTDQKALPTSPSVVPYTVEPINRTDTAVETAATIPDGERFDNFSRAFIVNKPL